MDIVDVSPRASATAWDDGATEYRQHFLYWIVNTDRYTVAAGDQYVILVQDNDMFDTGFDTTHGWVADFYIETGTYAGDRAQRQKAVIEGMTDEQGYNFGEGKFRATPHSLEDYPEGTWMNMFLSNIQYFYRQKVTLTDILSAGDIISDFAIGIHHNTDSTVGSTTPIKRTTIRAVWIEDVNGHLKKIIYGGHNIGQTADGEWHATLDLTTFSAIQAAGTHFSSIATLHSLWTSMGEYLDYYILEGDIGEPKQLTLRLNKDIDSTDEEAIIGLLPPCFMRGRMIFWEEIPQNMVAGSTHRDMLFTCSDIIPVPDGQTYDMQITAMDAMYQFGQQVIDVEYISTSIKDIVQDILNNQITTTNLTITDSNFDGDEIIPYIKFKGIPATEAISQLGYLYGDRYLMVGTDTVGLGAGPDSVIHFKSDFGNTPLVVERTVLNNVIDYIQHKQVTRDKATRNEVTTTKRQEEGELDISTAETDDQATGLVPKSWNVFVGPQMDTTTFKDYVISETEEPDIYTHVELRCVATAYYRIGELINLVADGYNMDADYIITGLLHDRRSIESVLTLKPTVGGISSSLSTLYTRLRNLEQSMSQNQPALVTVDNSLLIGEYPDGADSRNNIGEYGNSIRGAIL